MRSEGIREGEVRGYEGEKCGGEKDLSKFSKHLVLKRNKKLFF